MMKYVRNLLPFIILIVLWLLLGGHLNPIILPSLGSVWSTLVQLISSGEMITALQMSFFRITIATVVSACLSVPLGLLTVTFKPLEDLITPLTNSFRLIPVNIFFPLLITWVGIDEIMKVTFLIVATFFYFFPTVLLALKSVDRTLIEIALTNGASKFKLMTKIYLPAVMPVITQSFLMMYGIGWNYVIVAENINTRYGLGHLLLIGSARGRTDMVFATIFVIIGVSILIDTCGKFIIRKLYRWYFDSNEVKSK